MAHPQSRQSFLDEQAGLQVVPQEYSDGLQYVPPPSAEKQVFFVHSPKAAEDPNSAEARVRARKRRKRFIIGAVVGIVVVAVAAGAAGGVVASRNKNDQGAAGDGSLPGAGTSTGVSPAAMTGTSTVTGRYLYPTAVSWGYPHMEVFALTTNTQYSVYRKSRFPNATSVDDWQPSGKDFETVGGAIADGSSIAVRARMATGNNTDIFVTSSDGGLYLKWHQSNQVWSGGNDPNTWEPVDNRSRTSAGQPAVITRDLGLRDDIFVLGNGARATIRHLRWTGKTGRPDEPGTFSALENLGGADMQFAPAAVAWDDTRMDVFGVGKENNHLFHTFFDGSAWASFNGGSATFEDLGGFLTSTPAVVSRAKGTIDVFARGGDGGLWHLAYDGKAAPWVRISGSTQIQAQPDALSWDPQRIDVFAWGTDNALLTKTLDTNTGLWTPAEGFYHIGVGLSGPPKSVSDGPGSMHVFAYGQFGSLIWKSWSSSTGGKWPSGDFLQLGTPDFR